MNGKARVVCCAVCMLNYMEADLSFPRVWSQQIISKLKNQELAV